MQLLKNCQDYEKNFQYMARKVHKQEVHCIYIPPQVPKFVLQNNVPVLPMQPSFSLKLSLHAVIEKINKM